MTFGTPVARAIHSDSVEPQVPIATGESVYVFLLDSILTFELRPGQRLFEDRIGADFNLSRTPVREALLRLQQDGLVYRDKGWFVSQPNPDAARNVFELREAIEGFAARLAATRIDRSTLDRLREIEVQMENTRDPLEVNQLNELFHEEITRASGNELLVAARNRSSIHYWNFRRPVVFPPDELVLVDVQHRELLAALEVRDGARAEAIARAHIAKTVEIVLDGMRSIV
jgi:DNA-binding GntR family transcriptional regulator